MIIWYILFNTKGLLSVPDKAGATDIADLRNVIKETRSIKLPDIDVADITVWRCKQLTLLATNSEEVLQESFSEINFLDEEQVIELPSGADLADLELGKMEILLAQVPGLSSFLSLPRHQFLVLDRYTLKY